MAPRLTYTSAAVQTNTTIISSPNFDEGSDNPYFALLLKIILAIMTPVTIFFLHRYFSGASRTPQRRRRPTGTLQFSFLLLL